MLNRIFLSKTYNIINVKLFQNIMNLVKINLRLMSYSNYAFYDNILIFIIALEQKICIMNLTT